MGAGHPHSHDHDHKGGAASFGRAFAIGIALNLGFVIVETIFGFAANSMALLADAGHNLSDVLGLGGCLGRKCAGPAIFVPALHLWLQESLDPRRPDQRFVPADCRGCDRR